MKNSTHIIDVTSDDVSPSDVKPINSGSSLLKPLALQNVVKYDFQKDAKGGISAVLKPEFRIKRSQMRDQTWSATVGVVAEFIDQALLELGISVQDFNREMNRIRRSRIRGAHAAGAKDSTALIDLLSNDIKYSGTGALLPKDAVDLLLFDKFFNTQIAKKDIMFTFGLMESIFLNDKVWFGISRASELADFKARNSDSGFTYVMDFKEDLSKFEMLVYDPEKFSDYVTKTEGARGISSGRFFKRLVGDHTDRRATLSRSIVTRPTVRLQDKNNILIIDPGMKMYANRLNFSLVSSDGTSAKDNNYFIDEAARLSKALFGRGGTITTTVSCFLVDSPNNNEVRDGHEIAVSYDVGSDGKIKKACFINSNNLNTRLGFCTFMLPHLEEMNKKGMLSSEFSRAIDNIRLTSSKLRSTAKILGHGNYYFNGDAITNCIQRFSPEPYPILKDQLAVHDQMCMTHSLNNAHALFDRIINSGGKLPPINALGLCSEDESNEILRSKNTFLGLPNDATHIQKFFATFMRHKQLFVAPRFQAARSVLTTNLLDRSIGLSHSQQKAELAVAQYLMQRLGINVNPAMVNLKFNIYSTGEYGKVAVRHSVSIAGISLTKDQKKALNEVVSAGLVRMEGSYDSIAKSGYKEFLLNSIEQSCKDASVIATVDAEKTLIFPIKSRNLFNKLRNFLSSVFTNNVTGDHIVRVGQERDASHFVNDPPDKIVREKLQKVPSFSDFDPPDLRRHSIAASNSSAFSHVSNSKTSTFGSIRNFFGSLFPPKDPVKGLDIISFDNKGFPVLHNNSSIVERKSSLSSVVLDVDRSSNIDPKSAVRRTGIASNRDEDSVSTPKAFSKHVPKTTSMKEKPLSSSVSSGLHSAGSSYSSQTLNGSVLNSNIHQSLVDIYSSSSSEKALPNKRRATAMLTERSKSSSGSTTGNVLSR